MSAVNRTTLLEALKAFAEALAEYDQNCGDVDLRELNKSIDEPLLDELFEENLLEGDKVGTSIFSCKLTFDGQLKIEAYDAAKKQALNREAKKNLYKPKKVRVPNSGERLEFRQGLMRHVFHQRAEFWLARFVTRVSAKLEDLPVDWPALSRMFNKQGNGYSRIKNAAEEIMHGDYHQKTANHNFQTTMRILYILDDLCEQFGTDKISDDAVSLRLSPHANDIVCYRAAMAYLKQTRITENQNSNNPEKQTVRLHLFEAACILRYMKSLNTKERLVDDEQVDEIFSDARKDMYELDVDGEPGDFDLRILIEEWRDDYYRAQEYLEYKFIGVQQ